MLRGVTRCYAKLRGVISDPTPCPPAALCSQGPGVSRWGTGRRKDPSPAPELNPAPVQFRSRWHQPGAWLRLRSGRMQQAAAFSSPAPECKEKSCSPPPKEISRTTPAFPTHSCMQTPQSTSRAHAPPQLPRMPVAPASCDCPRAAPTNSPSGIFEGFMEQKAGCSLLVGSSASGPQGTAPSSSSAFTCKTPTLLLGPRLFWLSSWTCGKPPRVAGVKPCTSLLSSAQHLPTQKSLKNPITKGTAGSAGPFPLPKAQSCPGASLPSASGSPRVFVNHLTQKYPRHPTLTQKYPRASRADAGQHLTQVHRAAAIPAARICSSLNSAIK